MGRKIRRILLCLVTVSCMSTGGRIYADDVDFSEQSAQEETEDEAEEVGHKRSEAVESTDIDAEEVKKYMTLAGSSAEFDVDRKSVV